MCWAGPLTGDLVPLAPRHLTGRGNALRWGGTETWTSLGPLARRKARAPCNTLRARKGQHSRRLQTAARRAAMWPWALGEPAYRLRRGGCWTQRDWGLHASAGAGARSSRGSSVPSQPPGQVG